MSFYFLSAVFIYFSLYSTTNFVASDDVRYPAIFLPGNAGSQIWAKLNRSSVPHLWCYRHSDWFELWLDVRLLLPEVIDCFVDNMRLVYNTTTRKTSNIDGVDIQIPGFGQTSTIEYFDSSGLSYSSYFAPIVRSLVALGYTRGLNLRGAPYDFRRAPDEQEDYFLNLTNLVLDTYNNNNQTKVVLITHSMGGPFALYWLHQITPEFKEKYIRSIITIASPWGGAVKALRLMASGDNIDVYVVSPIQVRPYQRSAPSTAFVMPSPNIWSKEDVLVITPSKNYTVQNYDEFFNDINYTTGYQYWLNVKDLVDELKPPDIEVHALYGSQLPTPGVFMYNQQTFPDLQPVVLPDNGDGTVNMRSLLVHEKWIGKQTQDIKSLELPGVEHLAILKHPTTINYVIQVLSENMAIITENQYDKLCNENPCDSTNNEIECNDLAKLPNLTEDILLEHLQRRYKLDLIYTYLGDILVSINPFKETNLYSKTIRESYRKSLKSNTLPHVYALVDLVYQNVFHSLYKQQCCVISGESGSGKTESTKFFLKQLMYLCGGSTQLEQQILQANPLLEAFGNAQTIMNDNSSRFGKYIDLKFINGRVIGAQINDYLLEKSRVVIQSTGERNFHIFYYLFDYLPTTMKEMLHLTNQTNYKYISKGATPKLTLPASYDSIQHSNKLDEVINAMGLLGFTDKEQNSMFCILSGILTLGNIEFSADDEGFSVQTLNEENTKRDLAITAKMFGVSSNLLMECLTTVTTLTRNERVTRKYSLQSSQDARDALSKHLYARLFSFLISKINGTLDTSCLSNKPYYSCLLEIGLLDIYGFEHFENNSFEQLCINLANEQIQYFFNQHIFRMEMTEYETECITGESLTFTDNQPLLELFMAKPIGILSLLDDESKMPKASDATLVEKFNYHFASKRECYGKNRNNKLSFTIYHYAGKVVYNTYGFLEKNKDTLPDSVVDLLGNSRDDLIYELFNGTVRSKSVEPYHTQKAIYRTAAEKDAKNRMTVGAQYRNSLQILMERMSSSHPVFMRCIKPNQQKQPNLFDETFVRGQLRYCGMLETTRIRKEGYSVRIPFAEFIQRYGLLARDKVLNYTGSSCASILESAKLSCWQIGKTKVFLKYYHPEILDSMMNKYREAALKIQRRFRGYVARRRYSQLRLNFRKSVDQVYNFCATIEQMNVQVLNTLLRLNDKLPGKPAVPFPPARQSSLATISMLPASTVTLPTKNIHTQNSAHTNKISNHPILTEKVPSSTAASTVSSSSIQSTADYDSLLTNLTLKYGSPTDRESCLRWFRDTQYPFVIRSDRSFPSWFHGSITRHQAEYLLINQFVGCFLIRISESRFGFSLSFKAADRCRHYMINQLKNAKYNVIGEPKVHRTIDQLIEYYKTHELSNWSGHLTTPCPADWSQYDLQSLSPQRTNIYQTFNSRPYNTLSLPVSCYSNSESATDIILTARRLMSSGSLGSATGKLPIAIVLPNKH
ncbi:unnamed protein product [Didymodactylos carnosus]|uniref:non-specific serine/threonine protein kinase n=1 Tax=Didymodactylos carnosus TaxID=1234261 RepID=A0A813QH96_9BILA|nr:unnamed protein product [Didymodactylos carnosus]CAF3548182.1 unnamed protein product [Didymodactylos carnosus]